MAGEIVGTLEEAQNIARPAHPLMSTQNIEVVTEKIINDMLKHGRLSHTQKFELSELDIETISEKLAEKIHVKQVPHICQFDAETISALKNLGGLYTSTQTNFKRFIVGVIVTGLIIMLFIGAKHQAQEFLRALGLMK